MELELTPGTAVQVVALPPYVKTAEPMPMLRPPYVIRVGETGVVMDRRPGGYWVVRFEKGVFLIESQYLTPLTADGQRGEEVPASDPENLS